MKPLFHIGYHKTGTTFLQRSVFPKPEFSLVAKTRALWPSFVQADPFAFDAETAHEVFRPDIEEAAKQGLIPVLSAERLSGNPHSGGYDSVQIAERIAAAFPEARVLVVIREQTEMLISAYKQYLKKGGPGTLWQYAAPPSDVPRVPLFDLRFFEYHRLVGLYHRLFGPENVLVLPFEMLKNRPRAFLKRIGDFAGATVVTPQFKPLSVSQSALSLAFKRRANRWVVRDTLNPAPPFEVEKINGRLLKLCTVADSKIPASLRERSERHLREIAQEIVDNRYVESNAMTAELTKLELHSFGYACQ